MFRFGALGVGEGCLGCEWQVLYTTGTVYPLGGFRGKTWRYNMTTKASSTSLLGDDTFGVRTTSINSAEIRTLRRWRSIILLVSFKGNKWRYNITTKASATALLGGDTFGVRTTISEKVRTVRRWRSIILHVILLLRLDCS